VVAFEPSAALGNEPDYRLVQDTFVTMFRDGGLLESTTGWLAGRGYQVVAVDAGGWLGEPDLHRDLALALRFPDYYGRNLDALNDCLRDVASWEYGADPTAAGLVLVLRHYDRFAARQPRAAHAVLDIFAARARGGALFGHRMMCLVQSDDPGLRFPPVGATPVMWNDAEWLDSGRGPKD
jgi:RNAse (barnase) inhibitor barstar